MARTSVDSLIDATFPDVEEFVGRLRARWWQNGATGDPRARGSLEDVHALCDELSTQNGDRREFVLRALVSLMPDLRPDFAVVVGRAMWCFGASEQSRDTLNRIALVLGGQPRNPSLFVEVCRIAVEGVGAIKEAAIWALSEFARQPGPPGLQHAALSRLEEAKLCHSSSLAAERALRHVREWAEIYAKPAPVYVDELQQTETCRELLAIASRQVAADEAQQVAGTLTHLTMQGERIEFAEIAAWVEATLPMASAEVANEILVTLGLLGHPDPAAIDGHVAVSQAIVRAVVDRSDVDLSEHGSLTIAMLLPPDAAMTILHRLLAQIGDNEAVTSVIAAL